MQLFEKFSVVCCDFVRPSLQFLLGSAASHGLFWVVGQGLSSLFEQNLGDGLELGSQSQQHIQVLCLFLFI